MIINDPQGFGLVRTSLAKQGFHAAAATLAFRWPHYSDSERKAIRHAHSC